MLETALYRLMSKTKTLIISIKVVYALKYHKWNTKHLTCLWNIFYQFLHMGFSTNRNVAICFPVSCQYYMYSHYLSFMTHVMTQGLVLDLIKHHLIGLSSISPCWGSINKMGHDCDQVYRLQYDLRWTVSGQRTSSFCLVPRASILAVCQRSLQGGLPFPLQLQVCHKPRWYQPSVLVTLYWQNHDV